MFEIALLDAVDARVVQEASDPIDPSATTAEVPLEPEALGDPSPEVRRPVHGTIGDAPLVGANPEGESLLVMAREVGRGREEVEIIDVEGHDVEIREQSVGVAQR
jgi:hypothetical protein